MSATIHADNIGPFVQGPRLQGTPKDERGEPEDNRVQCARCLAMFAPDELAPYDGMMLCEVCEEERRAFDKRECAAEVRELVADYHIEQTRDRKLAGV